MWFATQNGLNRYDGYTFKVYTHDPSVANSLPDAPISCIAEDESGTLWIGTVGQGLYSFDESSGKFHSWKDFNGIPAAELSKIINIADSRDNKLWLRTYEGKIYAFNKGNHKYFLPCNENSLSGEIMKYIEGKLMEFIYVDNRGYLWTGVRGGDLYKYDAKNDKVSVWNINSLSNNNEIYTATMDHEGILLLGTAQGLFSFNPGSGVFRKISIPGVIGEKFSKDIFYSIFCDKEGKIWVGTNSDLYVLDLHNNSIRDFPGNLNNENAFHGNSVNCIFQDNEGILWFGTGDNGINICSKLSSQFNTFLGRSENVNATMSIFKDNKDVLWLGTYGEGILSINSRTGKVKRWKGSATLPGMGNDMALCMVEGHGNKLLIGNNNLRVTIYDIEKNTETVLKLPPKGALQAGGFVIDVMKYRDTLWIGVMEGGFYAYDEKRKVFKFWSSSSSSKNGLKDNSITKIHVDKRGNFWIGTMFGGLYYFDKAHDRFIQYANDPKKERSISNNSISSMYDTPDSNLWIATLVGGLNYFDVENKKFYVLTTKDGLPSNHLYGILPDDEGNLWISTEKGLSRFTPKITRHGNQLSVGGTFRNYDEKDGLQSNEFTQNSYFRAKDGTLYFGGVNGINYFDPKFIKSNKFIPSVNITELRLFNQAVMNGDKTGILTKNIAATNDIYLTYKQNVFSLEFMCTSYANPEKNKYAYKMEGFDKDWTYTDAKKRDATYTNLDPGEYIFRVKGCNNDGIWSSRETILKIHISPPFYKTWWFITLTIFFIIGSVVWIVRIASVRKYKKQLVELEHQRQIEGIRSRIARDIHDDIGSELTQISLLSEIIKRNEGSSSKSIAIIDRLNSSARAIIHNLGEIVWAINPQYDNLSSLLAYFNNYISQLLENTEIEYQMNFTEVKGYIPVNPELRRNLFLLLKEALSNILKHTRTSKITIRLEVSNDEFEFWIIDDGGGVDESKKSKFGNGMKNMDARMKSIGGTLEIISNPGKGVSILARGRIF